MGRAKKAQGTGKGPGWPQSKITRETPVVGLDVGYGHTKILFSDGRRVVFPSVAAPYEESEVAILGTGAEPVTVGRARFVVGEAAVGQKDLQKDNRDGWHTSQVYEALVREAARHIPAGAYIVSGLPLHVFMSHRKAAKELIREVCQAAKVDMVPQGFAAYYGTVISEQGEERDAAQARVAVIDVGYRTTELVAVVGVMPDTDRSAGKPLGIGPVMAEVAQGLTQRCGRPVHESEVDRALRGGPGIRVRGEVITDLISLVEVASKPMVDRLMAWITELWGDGRAFDRVLLVGGGSFLVQYHIQSWREDADVLPDGQFANATGYLRVGLLRRQATTAPVAAPVGERDQPADPRTDMGGAVIPPVVGNLETPTPQVNAVP